MRWIAISGSWRRGMTPEVVRDVRAEVASVMRDGNGIVTGGALGVDFVATDEALAHDAGAARIKIFLPSTLARYAEHYRNRAAEGVISSEQAESLIAQLESVARANPEAVVENAAEPEIGRDAYFARNTRIVEATDELVAFHVVADDTPGEGTLDAVEKARALGKPVRLHSYDLRRRTTDVRA